jgi:hypothetical protein
MVPTYDLTPTVPTPLPTCTLPPAEEISEEGFGYFRGTWFIGRVLVADAETIVREEGEILEWLDATASTPEEFDVLARAIETQEDDGVADSLGFEHPPSGLARFIGDDRDVYPLDGLEVGVAGLSQALSVVGGPTSASCRSHHGPNRWSDCPIVFFAAPTWRVEILADLVSEEGCGLTPDRGMLTVFGRSVREMHALALRILKERGRFRRMPDRWRTRRESVRAKHSQLTLATETQPRAEEVVARHALWRRCGDRIKRRQRLQIRRGSLRNLAACKFPAAQELVEEIFGPTGP